MGGFAARLAFGLLLLGAQRAQAEPGALVERSMRPGVVLHTGSWSCALPGSLCTRAGAFTAVLATPPVATTDAGAALSAPARYRRTASFEDAPWRIQVAGHLRRPSWAGNLIFVLFDLSNPTALEEHRFTALYQLVTPRSTQLDGELTLTPDDGFLAGHSYRLRVAQLIGGKEVILAETDVALE